MEVRRFDDPAAYLRAATAFLQGDEPRHNLLFGLVDALIHQPGTYPAFHLWLAVASDEPAGAMLQTPPYNVVLARPRSEAAIPALVDAALADAAPVPGVNGALPEAEAFARTWAGRTGGSWSRHMAQGIYACRAVHDVPAAAGAPRVGVTDDAGPVITMVEAFSDEAFIAQAVRDRSRSRSEAMVRARIAADPERGGFWLWEHEGTIVSISGHGGRTPNGIRIGPVYTPPEHRGRGYATALVHAQTSWLLANAVRACFLYTDLANPTSNGVYRRIGYELDCEAVEIGFEEAQPQSGGVGAAPAGSTT